MFDSYHSCNTHNYVGETPCPICEMQKPTYPWTGTGITFTGDLPSETYTGPMPSQVSVTSTFEINNKPMPKKYKVTSLHPYLKEGIEVEIDGGRVSGCYVAYENYVQVGFYELGNNPDWYSEVKEYPPFGGSYYYLDFAPGKVDVISTRWTDSDWQKKDFDLGNCFLSIIEAKNKAKQVERIFKN